jgi:hypothetical protein
MFRDSEKEDWISLFKEQLNHLHNWDNTEIIKDDHLFQSATMNQYKIFQSKPSEEFTG